VGLRLAARQSRRPADGDLLDMLADWVPDAKVRNRILAQNANALYGF
jgi:predicted TIM-barrel fold metal-dependent hydrolase